MLNNRRDTWSKDFVKHLRTVHFALVTLSLTLIVVTPSLSRLDYVKASDQVALLQTITTSSIDETIGAMWDADHASSVDVTQLASQSTGADGKRYAEGQPCIPDCLAMSHLHNIAINVVLSGPASNNESLTIGLYAKGADIATTPTTLFGNGDLSTYDGIRNFWAKLDHIDMRWIDVLSTPNVTVDGKSPRAPFLVWSSFDAARSGTILLKRDPLSSSPRLIGSANIGSHSVDVSFNPEITSTQFGRELFIKSSRQLTNKGEVFGSGDFDSAFGALAHFVGSFDSRYQNRIESEPLETIAKKIQAEQDKESLPAAIFGIPFPHDQLPSWGVILLICVQLYFWIHLCEISSRIHPDSPGWDVAWIGLYSQSYAVRLFKITTCILPPTSILLVSCIELSPYSRSLTQLEATALFLGMGAAMILGRLTHTQIQEFRLRKGLPPSDRPNDFFRASAG